MPRVIETAEEFQTRQGGEPVRLPPDRSGVVWYVFPSGARISQPVSGYAHREEPPADGKEVLTLRRQYHRTRLGQFEADFKQYKKLVTVGGVSFAWPEARYGRQPSDPAEALLVLQAAVMAERESIAALEGELHNLPEEVARREDARLVEVAARQAEAKREEEMARLLGITV